MESRFNFIKNVLIFLQEFTKTRFGSGALGVISAIVIMYFVNEEKIDNLNEIINSYKSENSSLKNVLFQKDEELRNLSEIERKKAKAEAQEYINYAISIIQNTRSQLPDKKEKTVQEIKQLEFELQKRKEVLQ